MKIGVVPSSWLSITGNMCAHSQLALLDNVVSAGINPNQGLVEQSWSELSLAAEKRIEAVFAYCDQRRREIDAEMKTIEALRGAFSHIDNIIQNRRWRARKEK